MIPAPYSPKQTLVTHAVIDVIIMRRLLLRALRSWGQA